MSHAGPATSTAGLLCFREGSLVGAAGLDRFGAPECIVEEVVDKWLRHHKVLHLLSSSGSGSGGAAPGLKGGQAAALLASSRGGGGASSDGGGGSSGEEGEEDDWQQPCEVCGRRYPHQHFRSAYATKGSGSESE